LLRPCFSGLNEYFSGFANIGHNSAHNLIFLWIIPNGLWLLFPAYIIYLLGAEILDAMDGSYAEKDE
jgi:phosphatidylglycerophosphate synthase